MHKITLWGGTNRWPFIVGSAIVDDEHAVLLSRYHYRLHHSGYVIRHEGRAGNDILLSADVARLMGWTVPEGHCIDFIDRDKLNCQSSNLRVVTKSVDMANRDLQSNNTSGHHGICWSADRAMWRARIKVNGKSIHLGYFTDIEEAARKVNDAYSYYFPEVPVPNVL